MLINLFPVFNVEKSVHLNCIVFCIRVVFDVDPSESSELVRFDCTGTGRERKRKVISNFANSKKLNF